MAKPRTIPTSWYKRLNELYARGISSSFLYFALYVAQIFFGLCFFNPLMRPLSVSSIQPRCLVSLVRFLAGLVKYEHLLHLQVTRCGFHKCRDCGWLFYGVTGSRSLCSQAILFHFASPSLFLQQGDNYLLRRICPISARTKFPHQTKRLCPCITNSHRFSWWAFLCRVPAISVVPGSTSTCFITPKLPRAPPLQNEASFECDRRRYVRY